MKHLQFFLECKKAINFILRTFDIGIQKVLSDSLSLIFLFESIGRWLARLVEP